MSNLAYQASDKIHDICTMNWIEEGGGESGRGRVGEGEKGRRNLRKSAGNKETGKTPCNSVVKKELQGVEEG